MTPPASPVASDFPWPDSPVLLSWEHRQGEWLATLEWHVAPGQPDASPVNASGRALTWYVGAYRSVGRHRCGKAWIGEGPFSQALQLLATQRRLQFERGDEGTCLLTYLTPLAARAPASLSACWPL